MSHAGTIPFFEPVLFLPPGKVRKSSVAPCVLSSFLGGGCPTKSCLPKKGFLFFSRTTDQLRGRSRGVASASAFPLTSWMLFSPQPAASGHDSASFLEPSGLRFFALNRGQIVFSMRLFDIPIASSSAGSSCFALVRPPPSLVTPPRADLLHHSLPRPRAAAKSRPLRAGLPSD